MTTATAPALTPVTITSVARSLSGAVIATEAVSDDGLWVYHRIDAADEGLPCPWEPEHVPSGLTADWRLSLDSARAATEDGTAMAEVERQLAHGRGEHDGERDPGCLACT